jgi:hypothetical protein
MADSILGPSQGETVLEGSTAPVANPKYAKYYEMNKATSEAGTSDGDAGEDSGSQGAGETTAGKPPAPKPEKAKQEDQGHKSGYDRRIGVLTAREKAANEQIRALEARLAALETPVQTKPKLTRDNFLTQEEYDDHRDRELTERVRNDLQKESLEGQKKAQEQNAFKSGWVDSVNKLYTTPEKKAAFSDLVRNSPDNLHKDVHEYIRSTEVGPMMLEAFLLRPDFAEQVKAMPSAKRAATLMRLEEGIIGHLEDQQAGSSQTRTPSRVTAAPTPIGVVGGNASGIPDPDSLPSLDRVRAYKKNRFER